MNLKNTYNFLCLLSLIGIIAVMVGCKNSNGEKKRIFYGIKISDLIGRSPEEFDKMLGLPTDITPITKDPAKMPGEYRNYAYPSLHSDLEVRFYRGKPVSFVCNLEKGAETAVETANYFGFNFENEKPQTNDNDVVSWSGIYNGVQISDVRAIKSRSRGFNEFRMRP